MQIKITPDETEDILKKLTNANKKYQNNKMYDDITSYKGNYKRNREADKQNHINYLIKMLDFQPIEILHNYDQTDKYIKFEDIIFIDNFITDMNLL